MKRILAFIKSCKLLALGIIGFAVIAIAFWIYLKRIGLSIMSGPAEFGQFGDFIGGTTNPILAFLTFLGVLWTIRLNHDELKYSNELSERQKIVEQKETIYRLIERIYEELNKVINADVRYLCTKQGTPQPYKTAQLKVAISECITSSHDWEYLHRNQLSSFLIIHDLLTQLKFYLCKYDQLAGDDLLSTYYRRHFCVVAMDLRVYNVVPEELAIYYESFPIYS